MSCSSKRNTAAGSCISTLVSRTNARRAPLAGRFFIDSELPGRGQNFTGVPLDADLAPFAADRALRVDQEGAALDAHHLATVHVLLLPGTEQRGHRVILVRAELEREIHLVLEFSVRLERIRRDAEYPRAGAPEGGREVAEVAALESAARRVVARVEVDHEIHVALVAEPELAARGRDGELRRLCCTPGCGHRFSSSPARGSRRGSSGRRSP